MKSSGNEPGDRQGQVEIVDPGAFGKVNKRVHLPYQADSREKEAFLNEYRLDKGWSVKEACDKANISISSYIALNNGTTSPLLESGEIKPTVKRLCKVLGADFFDAFPRYACKILKEGEEIVYSQVEDILGYKNDLAHQEFEFYEIYCLIKQRLSAMEFNVFIKMVLFETVLEDLAIELGLTREAIRMIYSKILKKLRWPAFAKKIRG